MIKTTLFNKMSELFDTVINTKGPEKTEARKELMQLIDQNLGAVMLQLLTDHDPQEDYDRIRREVMEEAAREAENILKLREDVWETINDGTYTSLASEANGAAECAGAIRKLKDKAE